MLKNKKFCQFCETKYLIRLFQLKGISVSLYNF